MDRVKINRLLGSEAAMDAVVIKGWVRTKRGSKTFSFMEINDGSCLKSIQVIAGSELANYDEIEKITTGSALCVTGRLGRVTGQGAALGDPGG